VDIQAFHEAVKRGDLATVRAASTEDPSLVSAKNQAGQSSILLAKYYGRDEIASYLLQLEPSLDIFEACAAGVTSVVRELSEQSDLLHSHSSDGWTPLHLAAFFGHRDLASALIDKGAQVDARSTNSMKNTPLHAAAAGQKAELVRLLLQQGADVSARQEGGWTALHSAAQSGHREILEALIANGADVNARASNQQTPLDLALQRGHESIVILLDELGAKLP
jgi:uncharacterized protein